ncbi:MAG: 4Fe-4S binding protein [archaeon]
MKIEKKYCKGCELCVKLCPFNNIEMKDGVPRWIDPEKCRKCKICEKYCPEWGLEIETSNGK